MIVAIVRPLSIAVSDVSALAPSARAMAMAPPARQDYAPWSSMMCFVGFLTVGTPRGRLPPSRAIARYRLWNDGILPAGAARPCIATGRRPSRLPARHSTANCTPLAGHLVRSGSSSDGLCRNEGGAQAAPAVDIAIRNSQVPPGHSPCRIRVGQLLRSPARAYTQIVSFCVPVAGG